MKSFLTCWIITFLLNSCISHKSILSKGEIEGVYFQKDLKGIELHLKKDSFVLLDAHNQEHLPTFKCCDTITYGKWSIDKKHPLLVFSTPENLGNASDLYEFYYVDMNVEEKIEPSNSFITFVIDNPIEEHYKKYDEKGRELFYTVRIDTGTDITDKKTDLNPIKIRKTNRMISQFEIIINPKHNIPIRDISAREIYTLPYEIKNPKSNLFKISIPELTYGFLSYKRLKDDYVKIISKNRLLWDGKEYIRK